GLSMRTGSARRRMRPSSGRSAPVRIFISVLFPAPFSPTSAWISPRPTSNVTSSSAFTPGNDLEMCSMRRKLWSAGMWAPGFLRGRAGRSTRPCPAAHSYGLFDVVGGDQFQINRDVCLHALAVEIGDGGLDAQFTHQRGLLRDGRREAAIPHCRYRVVDGVEADERDLPSAACRLSGLDRTEDHLVVVREHAVDVRLSREDVLEHRQALCAVEVRRLAGNDGHAGAFLAHVLVEALAAIACGGRTGDTLNLDDVALASQRIAQELSSHAP